MAFTIDSLCSLPFFFVFDNETVITIKFKHFQNFITPIKKKGERSKEDKPILLRLDFGIFDD